MKHEHSDKETLLQHAMHLEHEMQEKVVEVQKDAIQKLPFVFLGLSTFGGVAVFYGFEKIIEQTPFLADKPFAILLAGFVILILTGALYRKLN